MAFWTRLKPAGGRPLSLATRATLYAGALMAGMAIVCIGAIVTTLHVAAGQSARREGAGYSTVFASPVIAQLVETRDPRLDDLAERMALSRFRGVERVMVHDREGRVVASAGQGNAASPIPRGDARDRQMTIVRETMLTAQPRVAAIGDIVWTAAPITQGDAVVGVISVGVSRGRLKQEYLVALVPFFIIVIGFLILAVPLTIVAVRRRAKPLTTLTDFADRIVGKRFGGARIEIRTGDEFEKVAGALNQMVGQVESLKRRIHRLAYVDPATQLPNNDRFRRELCDFLERADSTPTSGAVIVFELDRLRRLLETLGHEAAEELLRAVAERLIHIVRRVDRVVRVQDAVERPSMIARLRSHEFALLAPSFADEEDAVRFAQMATSAINQPFDWRELKLTLDCAAGAVIAPRDGRDPDTLTRNARLALASARGQGNLVRFFTSSMDREALSRFTLEKDMRVALERGEFRAFFQPKIELATGRIVGAEALARWVRPDKTIVSPGLFVPAAEETGLIAQVGDAVMREACWNAAAWAREGLPIQVAVNVSPLQFRDERFPEHVIHILEEAAMPAFCLELEITESVVMENPEQAMRMIEPLRARGVRFAIDDFGCGHSSLAALSRLPFDVLKIDQQFVLGLQKDRHAPAIVETVLAMAATLDMHVVAEGIEREKDAEFLRRRGCGYGQGFLYGAATPASEFGERLRRERRPALSLEADVA